jgi:hypothetical protein
MAFDGSGEPSYMAFDGSGEPSYTHGTTRPSE